MSTRRAAPALENYEKEKPTRSRFVSFLLFLWKAFTCIFSHVTLITLVVAYCILGAFTFEHLEADNEKEVKKGIVNIRHKVTESIWKMTYEKPVLHQGNWTDNAIVHLQDFENQIISAMKKDGWDGNENDEQIQWTFFGALFYSIIVITTIGYGHIAPKTHMGKISTIFYAILGIPLMLLCLSNIGDIMASSFRFLYWRVCCYVCTREPKSRRSRSQRGTIRQGRSSTHSQPPPNIRRSIRTSQRSTDSGVEFEAGQLVHAYSEMDFRYQGDYDAANPRTSSRGNNRMRGRNTIERDRNFNRNNLYSGDIETNGIIKPPEINLNKGTIDINEIPPQRLPPNSRLPNNSYQTGKVAIPKSAGQRAQSLDRRLFKRDTDVIDLEEDDKCKTPVLCNKYALDDEDESDQSKVRNPRSQSIPRQSKYGDRLGAFQDKPPIYSEDTEIEMQGVRKGRRTRPLPSPSPRIMSPMGFAVHRQARHLQTVIDDNSLYDEDWENQSDVREKREMMSSIVRPVPIWLCVFLVISYIIGGAFMFSQWENWSFLDSAYFCFITLTTIGFGDFVPAQGVKDSQISIGICSLYLLFGIALLAMSFNLVQEEVISNVKSVARRLGILKEEEADE